MNDPDFDELMKFTAAYDQEKARIRESIEQLLDDRNDAIFRFFDLCLLARFERMTGEQKTIAGWMAAMWIQEVMDDIRRQREEDA